ncbi:MAG: glycosyltransferase [Gemmatimonadales bacterium]
MIQSSLDSSTSEPLVSVVIVAHDNWPDLELAVESALCQSWKRLEVIVVDNDSADATPAEIASRYGARVRYVRQANKLDGGGYNRGIAESNGDYVQLLDGDDFLAPNKIARQLETFLEHPDADIVYGDVRQFQGQAGRPQWSDWDTRAHTDMLATLISPAGAGAGLVPHSALFRRSALDRVGPWDESLVGADMDFWLRASWAGCVFVYSPGSWCFHRRRPSQMSADASAMVNRTVTTLEKALIYIDREPYRSMTRSRLAGLYYGSAMTDLRLDRWAALAALRSARDLDPRKVSALPFAIGVTAASIPGARRVLKARPFRAIRRAVARSLGVLD